jgi:thioredoxin 1
MKYFLIFLIPLTICFSCKKKKEPLVDSSENEIVDITSIQQMNNAIASGVSMVFFHASWCSKCANQRTAVETVSVSTEFSTIFFGEVEFDDHQDVVAQHNVQGFPTIVFYKNGQEMLRMTGENNTVEQISDKIRELM